MECIKRSKNPGYRVRKKKRKKIGILSCPLTFWPYYWNDPPTDYKYTSCLIGMSVMSVAVNTAEKQVEGVAPVITSSRTRSDRRFCVDVSGYNIYRYVIFENKNS